jgi:hypothetical protein
MSVEVETSWKQWFRMEVTVSDIFFLLNMWMTSFI